MPARANAKRINPIKLQQMREQAKQFESRIAELEAEIQHAELRLAGFLAGDEAARVALLIVSQRAALETAMGQWEEITQQIEATA
jgi:hypothetical protein